jgi:hypothetical protein
MILNEAYIPKQVVPEVVQIPYKKVNLNTLQVIVDKEEYEMCETSSKNMWANSKKGLWGRGYINTEDDPRRVERVGRLGEMALCKISNTPIDLSYVSGGDKHDTIVKNKSINVKTAIKLYGVVMIRCEMYGRTIPLKSDFYVFCYLSAENKNEKRAILNILGYLPKSELIKKEKISRREWVNYECPYNELKDVNELIKNE